MRASAKLALRDQLLTTRRRRSLLESGAAARAIAGHLLAAPEVRRAATVAAYVSRRREPGTGALLDALLRRRPRVILPVLLPDGDLDWAALPRATPRCTPRGAGCSSPTARRWARRGRQGPTWCWCPGWPSPPTGCGSGRGGGSYDRALARVPVGTFTCVLLHDDEVGLDVPAEPHDRRVRRGRDARRGDPPGVSVSVSCRPPSTARGEKAHGSVSPRAHRSVWSV